MWNSISAPMCDTRGHIVLAIALPCSLLHIRARSYQEINHGPGHAPQLCIGMAALLEENSVLVTILSAETAWGVGFIGR